MSREHRIKELAYQLWVARGCPAGNSDQDWLEAERQLSAAEPTKAASTKGVDDALKDTYPASDPPASHLPDEPPANAEAKWEAAAAADDSKLHANAMRRTSDAPRPRSSGRKPQAGKSDQTRAAESPADAAERSRPAVKPRPRPPGQ
jgi:hypothetical protein